MSKILNQHPSNNFFQIARLSRKNLLRSVLLIIPLVLLFLLRSFDFQRDEKILAQENKIMQESMLGCCKRQNIGKLNIPLERQNFSCRSV